MQAFKMKILLIRMLILIVIYINYQCAIAFLFHPDLYAPSFELTGETGKAAVRGFGLLFIMWNIPYLVAAWNPIKHRTALYESLAMQTIGLFGEVYIRQSLPLIHASARSVIARFIIYDALGMAALIVAVILSRNIRSNPQS